MMKNMLKILSRYVATAAGVALTLLLLNLTALIIWMVQSRDMDKSSYRTSEVAASLTRTADGFSLDATGENALRSEYQWAMLLSDGGKVIWEENLPDGLPRSYTVSDVASFSRWYLDDYPVYVWQHPDGLLVLGKPQDSTWKHGMEMQSDILEKAITWLPGIVLLNAIAAVLLSLIFGLRLFRALQPLARGIDDMAQNKPVSLSTSGLLGDLAGKLTQTSVQLQHQAAVLQKRDDARTNWINGISHDIRTPLSLVMGYASQMENDSTLQQSEREQAHIIRTQSEKIKNLVNDLNLASKLEYDMQPLRIVPLNAEALIRSVVADFFNSGLDDHYQLELQFDQEARSTHISGDEELIKRAVSNLLQNSIRHNPDGCSIGIDLKKVKKEINIVVTDNGKGFSKEVLENQKRDDLYSCQKRLGLTIVHQIIKAHGGWLELANLPEAGCSVTLHLPAATIKP